jgi:hypothetical protein
METRTPTPLETARGVVNDLLSGPCYPSGNGGTATSETEMLLAWQDVSRQLAKALARCTTPGTLSHGMAAAVLVAQASGIKFPTTDQRGD